MTAETPFGASVGDRLPALRMAGEKGNTMNHETTTQAAYWPLFERYGSPADDAEIRLIGHLTRPEALTQDRIPYNDQQAARLIASAKRLITQLTAYRQDLAARYGALETMPYRYRLELVRRPPWNGKGVTYTLTLTRVYEDATEREELQETYTGKDRRAALVRFDALAKDHPGAQLVKDLEKKSWER